MYKRQTLVFLSSTDATGVIYFTEQLRFASETFEEFLLSSGLSLKEMIAKGDLLLPIVHVEGDFKAPIRVGDMLTITLNLEKMGDKSFALSYTLSSSQTIVGTVKIIHAALKRGKSIVLPDELKSLLSKI